MLLLINENPAVSRLIKLSCEKYGYELEEISDIESLLSDSYDYVFIDSDLYSDELLEALKSKAEYKKIGYIATKGSERPEGMDFILEKPFLPTDFVDIVNALKSKDDEQATKKEEVDMDLAESSEESFDDLGDLEDLSEEDDMLEELDIEKDKDFDDLEIDLKNNEETGSIDDLDIDLKSDEEIDSADELDISLLEDDTKDETDDEKDEMDIEIPDDLGGDLTDLQDLGSIGDIESIEDITQTQESQSLEDLQTQEQIPTILDKEEVEEVKELLEEEGTDELLEGEEKLEMADEDFESFDIEEEAEEIEPQESENDIKVENDEFASLTEEALAEALGEEKVMDMPQEADQKEATEEDFKEIEETYETKEPQSLSQISEKEIKGSVISGLLNVDVLKEVLDGMEMQITIKFKNKKKKK